MSSSAETEPRGNARRIRRIFKISLLTFLSLVAALAGAWELMKLQAARERAAWKGPALERLVKVSLRTDELQKKFDELRADPAKTNSFWAADERVLLMANGEYIVFAFRHGANDGFVDHLFLGHSSDGRWLYSTFHFCNMMAGILGEDPPASITEFQQRYSVREFDGKSDECLKHTWPTN